MKEFEITAKEKINNEWVLVSGLPYFEAETEEEAIQSVKDYIKDCIHDNFYLSESEIEKECEKVESDEYLFTAIEIKE